MNFKQVIICCALFLVFSVEQIYSFPELTTRPQAPEVNTRRFMRPRRNFTSIGNRTSSSVRGADGKLSPDAHLFDTPAISPINKVEGRIIGESSSLKQRTAMGSQIFFPGATAIKIPQKTLKPNCTDTYCTEIPDYPLNVLKNLDLEKFLPYFNDDIEENVVQTRLNAPEEESLCDSVSKKIYPRQGWTQDNQMLIIINHDKYRQGILVEECTSSNSQCRYADSFPLNKSPKCKQKYVYRQLIALNQDNQTVQDYFKFPSCCNCVLTTRYSQIRADPSSKRRSTSF